MGLLARLVDAHGHFQGFAAAAITRATDRRGAEVVEPDRDPHMGIGRANPVGRVKAYPAQVLDMGFSPGVASLLRSDAIRAVEVAADIARRNGKRA